MKYGTLLDYVSWRGDLPFEKDGFNEVDNLVFSFLAYSNFINVPVSKEENESGLSVKEYYDRLMKIGGFPKTLSWIIKENELKIIAESKRFGNVLIRHYTDIVKGDEDDAVQFAGMDFCFSKNLHYLAFRGTDDSIAGWREDTNLTYQKVPAQDLAVDFLNSNITEEGKYYIGGHSKGGNLAIYGAGKLSDEKLQRVIQIYDNDGPGICSDVMDISFLKRIDKITTRIIPTYSVIGMFFPIPFTNTKIVHSNEKMLMQHDIKSWQVTKKELYLAERLDPEAENIDHALALYISDTKLEEREKVIKNLFDAFDEKGRKKTVTSVTGGGLKELGRVLKSLANQTPETKMTLSRLPFTVWFAKTLMKVRHTKPIQFLLNYPSFPISIYFLILGLIFLFVPFNSIPYFIGGSFLIITLIELITFFYLLYLSHWNLKGNLTRLYLSIILISLSISYFVSGNIMAGFSSIIFGIIMMISSFSQMSRMIENFRKKNYFSGILSFLECLTMLLVGLYFVIINNFANDILPKICGWIFIGLGCIRFFDGCVEWIRNLLKEHK